MGRDDIINLANVQDENNGREENKPLHASDLFKKNHTTKNQNNVVIHNINSLNVSLDPR